jgi:DNA-directed RNA polymerase subunit RPC12/RpoP
MGQWYCFKCKEEMVEGNITLHYFEITRAVKGIKCPKCGAPFFLEQTVEEVVRRGEEAIESK